MHPVNSLHSDEADQRTTCQGTNGQTHVKANVIVRRAEVYEVTRTNGNNTTHCHNPEQTARNVENHGEAHGRNGAA